MKHLPCFDRAHFNLVWSLQGVVVWRWLMVCVFFSVFCLSRHQYPVQLHACSGGAALPLLLATHLHPCAARVDVGYCLLSHSLPGGAAVQLFAEAQGVACGRGECTASVFSVTVYLWVHFLFQTMNFTFQTDSSYILHLDSSYVFALFSLSEACFLEIWKSRY